MVLLQDKELPSVVGIFASRVVPTSWWSIPEARDIFACLDSLDDEAIATRLIKRKVTFVHRDLWPVLITLGSAREPWQTEGLSVNAKQLLAKLGKGSSVVAKGGLARELQDRLLVAAHEVHTESGRHEVRLDEWAAWGKNVGAQPLSSVDAARSQLEAAATRLGAPDALPWRIRRR